MSHETGGLLIKNADYVVTMDGDERVLEGASVLVDGNMITEVGHIDPGSYDKVIDGAGKIVLPGLINSHHHTFQALLRGHPDLQNQPIDRWIGAVSDVARVMDEDMIYNAARSNMAELVKYGCTTTTDMMYLFPKGRGDFMAGAIAAAGEVGMRFHPYRGSMSQSQKDGAFFPDDMVEDSDTIASSTVSLIQSHHDSSPFSMLRIGVAPCAIYASSALDYLYAADIAFHYGVQLQTHLGESAAENEMSVSRYGKRPFSHLREMSWEGKDVSFVHCINIDDAEVGAMARAGIHIVHCPISNARAPVGDTGIARVSEMLEAGINVAIGTDGSAGNDSSNVREELKWARTMQGVRRMSTYLSPIEALRMATRSGARLLNWPEIGSLAPGQAADIAVFSRDTLEQAGSWDPLAALVSTQATPAEAVIINGRMVVEDGQLCTVDAPEVVRDTNVSLKKLREKFRY